MNTKHAGMYAKLMLFGATLIWGSSFFIMKNTLDSVPVFYLLFFRFFVAAIVLVIISFKKLAQLNRDYLIKGSVMGVLLLCGYIAQTFGLLYTTPGKNSFLTAAYCILVPFLNWAVAKMRPDIHNIAAAVVCVGGIGLVSMGSDFSIGIGDALTLLCAVFYALHIVCVAKFSQERDIFLLTAIQFASAAALSGVFALGFEKFPLDIGAGAVWSLAYLCLFATAAALLLQNVGQKYTPPAAAALILSLESVFGVLFSIVFYHEQLTLRIALGFVLIFAAVIISETKLRFPARAAKRESE